MNLLKVSFPYSFAEALVPLSWHDVHFGIVLNFFSESAAVDHAAQVIRRSDIISDDLLDLSWVRGMESIYPYIDNLVATEENWDDSETKRRFCFLSLHWVYYHQSDFQRADIADPFDSTTAIYEDFDFPPAVRFFVPYAGPSGKPLPPKEAEQEMFAAWKAYLDKETAYYARLKEL